jgi:hypothetical protein
MLQVKKITYFDTQVGANNLSSLSFYLNGIYRGQKKWGYRFDVCRTLPAEVKKQIGEVPRQMALFHCETNAESFYFSVDRTDSNFSIHGPQKSMLALCRFIFKANYHRGYLNACSEIHDSTHKYIPISHSFPVQLENKFPFALKAFDIRKDWSSKASDFRDVKDWSLRQALHRLRYLFTNRAPELEAFCQLRNQPRDIDVFFVMAYYEEDLHNQVSKFRADVMLALKELQGFNMEIGFVSSKPLPEALASLVTPKMTMSQYLAKLVRSKVAIYVRGPHDCLSSKFAQYLALGKPVIGQSLANDTENLNQYPYFKEQFAFDDAKSLVKEVEKLLRDEKRMKLYASSNADVFDKKVSPDYAASIIMQTLTQSENQS